MKSLGFIVVLFGLITFSACLMTFQDAVIEAMCILEYPNDKPHVQSCRKIPRKINHLAVQAEANVTLVCQDVNYIVLAHNPGVFVIEHRMNENDTWTDALVSDHTKVSVLGDADTMYQYRFHRVFSNGTSEPEVTDWYQTIKNTYIPAQISNISKPFFNLMPEDPYHLTAEFDFTPADRSCYYEVIPIREDNQNDIITMTEPLSYNVTLSELVLDTEYTVTVAARTHRLVQGLPISMNFKTPSCLEVHYNLTLCVPAKVKDLNATAIPKIEQDFFDVNVTWQLPDLIPDFYNVELKTITANDSDPIMQQIPGNFTNTIFRNVRIIELYFVTISASSSAGRGPAIYDEFSVSRTPATNQERNVNYPLASTSSSANVGTIVITFLASVILIGGTGIYAYHRHGKRKRSQKRLRYFESLDQKDAALETIKDIDELPPRSLTTGVEDLLTPVDEYEINPDCLEIKRVLGSGAFGVVKFGSLRDDRGQVTDVAIKMLRDDPNEEDLRSFELEIKMMKSAGQHPNIVSLLGCCTVGRRPLLVVEYCSRGDLQSFLRSILEKATTPGNQMKAQFPSNERSEDERQFSNFVSNRAYELDQDNLRSMITVADLLNFGRQIATGMEFLSSNRVVHRDLAARNVLVCHDRTVKISDFGLSRDIYQENVYKKQGNGRVPVKWMAIESLTHQIYTTSSDVWSFGILLWEIVTLGSSPYPDIPANGVLKRLRSGYRMERPANCSVPLYNVMLSCWKATPRERPTFTVLRQMLDELIGMDTPNEYLDLNDISRRTIPEDEECQILNSTCANVKSQVTYMNDTESKVI